MFSFLLVAPQNRAGGGRSRGGKGVNFLLSSSINNGCAVEGVRLQRDLLIRGLVGAPQAITVLQLHEKKNTPRSSLSCVACGVLIQWEKTCEKYGFIHSVLIN